MVAEHQTLNILIVEDEPLIAMLAEEMVRELGHFPIVASSCDAAMKCMTEHEVDAAILDFTLAGETSEEVAHVLRERQIPLAFTTGHGLKLSEIFEAELVLPKPYSVNDFSEMVDALALSAAGDPSGD